MSLFIDITFSTKEQAVDKRVYSRFITIKCKLDLENTESSEGWGIQSSASWRMQNQVKVGEYNQVQVGECRIE